MNDTTDKTTEQSGLDARMAALTPEKRALVARRLAERGGLPPQLPVPPAIRRTDTVQLSFAQQRLWLLDRMLPGGSVYNEQFGVRLVGALDIAALRQALNEIVRRHDVLRVRFGMAEGSPVATIAPDLDLDFPVDDLQVLPEGERENVAQQRALEEAQAPFDLAVGPLLRVRLLRIGERSHWMLVTLHHIVTDGWSRGVLARELSALYRAFRQGAPSPLGDLPVQYAEYAAWQRGWLQGSVLDQQLQYWKQILADMPVLELPADRTPPAMPSYRGGRVALDLGDELTRGLRALGQREGATLFMTLLAAFQVLLYRLSGQEDVAVGVPIAGRARPEFEVLIGIFVNTLVLRGDLSGEPSFLEHLAKVRTGAIDTYAHQDLPFEKLVEELAPKRDLARNPLVQVFFNLVSVPGADLELDGLTVETLPEPCSNAKFDLSLRVTEVAGRLDASFEYSADLFDHSTIERMAGHWRVLLEGIVAEPERAITRLPLLTRKERQQLLVEWNDTAVDYPRDQCIHQLFEQQVERTPDAVAVVCDEQQLTYRELNARANQLAHHLRTLGVGPETLVGIWLERSLELVVGLLGILKAGGAYLPLDPNYPAQRLAFMLADARPTALVTQRRLHDQMRNFSAQVVCLDRDWPIVARQPATNPLCATTAGNIAYVIYTSGSTGKPNGVVSIHRACVNRCHWMWANFPFGPDDVCCQRTAVSFVDSAWEIFGPLLQGVTNVIIPDHVVADPVRFVQTLTESRITRVVLVPSLLRTLLDADIDLNDWVPRFSVWICSGETLPVDLRQRFHERLPGRTLLNLYGSSEVAADATWHLATPRDRPVRVPIGRPIANTQVYLLDAHQELVPVGVPGELYIGGDGLARGYLRRPELTAQRFVLHPFSAVPGERLFRTGDRAKYLIDGNLEFLGRRDEQLKIRGCRIELGEIATSIAAHPQVSDAVVLADDRRPDDRRLIAYVVLSSGADVKPIEIRTFLRSRLPDFMLPAATLFMAAFPRLPNGKIDRNGLPLPGQESYTADAQRYVIPHDPVEEQVAAIWKDLLRVDRVGVHDDFFELGGHSLLAMRMLARMETIFRVFVSGREFFDDATVANLARIVARSPANAKVAENVLSKTFSPKSEIRRNPRVLMTRVPVFGSSRAMLGDYEERPGGTTVNELPRSAAAARSAHICAASYAQQRLWTLDRLSPFGAAYNVIKVLRLTGVLNVPVLTAAVNDLVRRHEALRTTIGVEDGEPVQVIAPQLDLTPAVIDLSGLSDEQRETEAQRLARNEAQATFELERGPLIRVQLLRLQASEHWLLFTIHHIIVDGWSMTVLMHELSVLYDAFSRGDTSPLPKLPVRYVDFAVQQHAWLSGAARQGQLDYWRAALANLPVLEFPTDRPRPPAVSYRGAKLDFEIGEDLTRGLRDLSQREQTTLFTTLLAAFQVLLYRYTGQEDLAVGVPVAGRRRKELQGLVGLFVNTLVLRGDLSGAPSFREYLGRVRERTVEAYARQDLPFAMLVEQTAAKRDLSRNPLFQVSFVKGDLMSRRPELAGLVVANVQTKGTETAKYDLTVSVTPERGKVHVGIEYSTELFDHSTIERLAANWGTLLESIVADPEQTISLLPLLTQAQRHQVLSEWNATAVDYPRDQCIHQLFEQQVERTPDAVAVVFMDHRLTYRELNARANQLAHHLLALGIDPEVRVAVAMERSLELVVALLGILKAGGAYVPLDPGQPTQRLAFMLADTEAKVLLTQQRLLPHLPDGVGRTLCLDRDESTAAKEPDTNPPCATTASHLAYVVYTSGSTGYPKGVMIEHRAVISHLYGFAQRFPIGPDDRVLQTAPIGFDVSLWQMFLPLINGARVVLPEPAAHRSGADLVALIRREEVTILRMVPSMLSLVVDTPGFAQCTSLRMAISAGEVLGTQLAQRFHATSTAVLCNAYGPTETTFVTTIWTCRQHEPRPRIPAGRPIGNARIYLLDASGEPVPIGTPAEVFIGGDGVARGYLNRPAVDAERFLLDPSAGSAGARMYRTGDIARHLPDGNIEFLGRRDHQIKVRGVRIELGEIESVLARMDAVREAVAVLREDVPGDPRLVAYVAARGAGLSLAAVRTFAGRILPDYMVPAAFVILPALPRTPSGKVDRSALPAPAYESSGSEHAPPRTSMEWALAEIMAEVLNLDRVGRDDNFFELGGHSLLAVRLINRINHDLNVDVSLRQLFETPTVSGLALAAVDNLGTGVGALRRGFRNHGGAG